MKSIRIVRLALVAGAIVGVGCGESAGIDVGGWSDTQARQGVTGAVFTTTNTAVDGTGHCKNGNEDVNCNIYDGKEFVWLTGGPAAAALGNGTYFFAVLEPGGQGGNDNPNDGTEKNLSDTAPTSGTGAGDAYTNRIFTLTDGVIGYGGTHDFANNKIRLMPYDDTPNPGGEYILAICSLDDGYPVDPSVCKYDAFKVKPPPLPDDLDVSISGGPGYDKTFRWTIAKSVDQSILRQSNPTATLNYAVVVEHDGGTTSNWVLDGTALITNPTNAAVTPTSIVVVVSPAAGDATWTCDALSPVAIPAKGSTSVDYRCRYDAIAGHPTGGFVTATVTWMVGGASRTAADTNALDIANATPVLIGECADVTDTVGGDLGTVCVGDANPTTFTYSRTITGTAGTCTTFDNTASYQAIDTGANGSASQSARLCVGADLTITKDATPSFTRTYLWNIGKSVDKTVVKQIGGSATSGYTVDAWQTGYSDGGWALAGKIAVTNPNDWESVTVNVFDAAPGLTCTVTNGIGVVVAAGATVTLDYACSASNGNSGTNTATVVWDQAAAFTPSGSADGTAPFQFTTPTTRINPTIRVVDSYTGALGTLTATDATPYAAGSFTYSRTVVVPTWDCIVYDNTATITETGQSSSQGVKVCGPVRTGALTMGFWQNKNGQALVAGGASTGGVCNVGTWLRTYAPFQDLATTASCSAVASYVFNVIKAANASGSSMNAMLKAQMLATALDVYFSAPALGGNRINAPAPIGGISVDLTQVCTDIGSCTSFANVSPALGGATSLSVLQILAYVASQSNPGGSLWYGNVKSTQELAKDVFDAINNQKVFAP